MPEINQRVEMVEEYLASLTSDQWAFTRPLRLALQQAEAERDDANSSVDFWAEQCKKKNRELNALPRCHFRITSQMDDGELAQLCDRPKGHDGEHRFIPAYAALNETFDDDH